MGGCLPACGNVGGALRHYKAGPTLHHRLERDGTCVHMPQRNQHVWTRRMPAVQAVDKVVRKKSPRSTPAPEAAALPATFRPRVPSDAAPLSPAEGQPAPRRRGVEPLEQLVGAGALLATASASGARGFAPVDPPRGLSGKQLELQRQAELDPLNAPIDERHQLDGAVFHDLVSSCNLSPSWRPQVTLFCRLGMSKRDLRVLSAENNARIFTAGTAATLQRKLTFLREEAGLSDLQIKRLLLAYPRIVEYSLPGVLEPHLAFFRSLGIAKDKLAQVVVKAPSAMAGMSLEGSLEPRTQTLTRLTGLARQELGRIVQRCPAVLTLSEDTMAERIKFLQSCGLADSDVARAVTRHPEVLYYRPAAMEERVDWLLEGVGLEMGQLPSVIASQPAILSLDIAHNLQPKWQYLQQQLGGSSATVARYPVYLTLSLMQRIVPRHRYLCMVRGAMLQRPFPVTPYLTWSDAMFVDKGARTSVEEYHTFRTQLLASLGRNNSLQAGKDSRRA